jgi:hypothetical protein
VVDDSRAPLGCPYRNTIHTAGSVDLVVRAGIEL